MDLDPVVHQPTRLRILTLLYRNRQASFTTLRDELDLTDGNVSTHTKRLEQEGYLESRRVLEGLSFQVRYRITPQGSEAFERYLDVLREIVASAEESR